MYISLHMHKDPVTIGADLTISEAKDVLDACHFRHLPVVDQDKRLLGMVTDRDIRSAYPSSVQSKEEIDRELAMVRKTPVRQIMSTDFVFLTLQGTLDDALLLFDQKKVGALPVLDQDGCIVGIFSIRDLTKAYNKLFGLGERGSALVAVRHDGKPKPLTRIIRVLEEHDIHFSRVVRKKADTEDANEIIYIRVNTYNIHAVHKHIEEAGFMLEIPMMAQSRQNS